VIAGFRRQCRFSCECTNTTNLLTRDASSRPDWTFDDMKGSFRGSLGIQPSIGSLCPQISAFTRHSEFVLMPEVQAVYLPAIRSIARALGGPASSMAGDDSALRDSPASDDGQHNHQRLRAIIQKAGESRSALSSPPSEEAGPSKCPRDASELQVINSLNLWHQYKLAMTGESRDLCDMCAKSKVESQGPSK